MPYIDYSPTGLASTLSQPPSKFEQNRQFLLGQAPDPSAPIQLSGAGAPPGTSTDQEASIQLESGTPGTAPGGATVAPQTYLSQTWKPGAGSAQEGLLGVFPEAVAGETKTLEDIGRTFQEQAGPSRTWEGIGGQETLNKAISFETPIAERQPAFEQAADLTQAEYGGPTGYYDPAFTRSGDVATTAQDIRAIQDKAAALRTGYGLTTLLANVPGGLTRGEAKMEAKELLADPVFIKASLPGNLGVSQLGGQLASQTKGAEEFAKQRTAEEEAIREKSQEYLTGVHTGISKELDEEVARRNAQQKAAEDAWFAAYESGDLSKLGAAPEGTLTFDPSGFRPPEVELAETAERAYWDTINEYDDVSHIGPLDLSVTTHGNEVYSLPGETRPLHDALAAGAITPDQYDHLMERQAKLDELYSPGSKTTRAEELAPYLPLYYGAENPVEDLWQPADWRLYIEYDPGVLASRGNISTEAQRYTMGRINALMENLEAVESDTEPFRAASVAANLEQFLADARSDLAERGAALGKGADEWRAYVRGVERRYQKAKKKREWGKIARVVGDTVLGTVTLGGHPIARNTLASLGMGDLANFDREAGATLGPAIFG